VKRNKNKHSQIKKFYRKFFNGPSNFDSLFIRLHKMDGGNKKNTVEGFPMMNYCIDLSNQDKNVRV